MRNTKESKFIVAVFNLKHLPRLNYRVVVQESMFYEEIDNSNSDIDGKKQSEKFSWSQRICNKDSWA
jgi:hypothetical protein